MNTTSSSHTDIVPSMSFLMIIYNQEKTIEQALQSALAQDYSNLEIIVCNDCSKDRTFEIAAKIAADYHGPFKIILHRNDPNLGANFHKAGISLTKITAWLKEHLMHNAICWNFRYLTEKTGEVS